MFIDRLREAAIRTNSLVCVGLDVDPDRLPDSVKSAGDPVFAFNKAIIDATADLVCAYKPNLAFYEALGPVGLDALAKTVKYVPKDSVVIGDAKRGDIGSTARMYARALFDVFGFDAATVNPYLGGDSVLPFLEFADRGVFVLCKTSNQGSGDFQDLRCDAGQPERLFEHVARKVKEWNGNNNCGLVVGATYPADLRTVREICPDLPILIPGVGAQGGALEDSVRAGVSSKRDLAVINSSRGIIYASGGPDFADAARKATLELRAAINDARSQAGEIR